MGKGKGVKGGGKKGGAKHSKAKSVSYKVVQQSYEDPDYDENEPAPVMVPTAQLDRQFQRKSRKPILEFHDDMPEDYSNKRNMLMADDEAPDGIFDDEVEEEFDQDFIQQMMENDEEEEEWDSEDEEDPTTQKRKESKHKPEEHGTEERKFAHMMKDFDKDFDVAEEDPRVRGSLPVEAYSEALVAFAEDNAGTSWMDHGEHIRHKGFINQLKKLSHNNNIFDSNNNGLFYALLPDKGARLQKAFVEEHKELIKLTQKQFADGSIDAEDILHKPEEEMLAEDGTQIITVKCLKHERMDCETVCSTYSTLYNRPNIVAAEKGKLKIPKGMMKRNRGHMSTDDLTGNAAAGENAPAAIGGKKKVTIAAAVEEEEAAAVEDEDALPNFEEVRYDLSMPKKDETKEEKKIRQKLVKQLQAERRQDKKGLQGAYGVIGKQEVVSRKMSRTDRKIQPMSLIAGVVSK